MRKKLFLIVCGLAVFGVCQVHANMPIRASRLNFKPQVLTAPRILPSRRALPVLSLTPRSLIPSAFRSPSLLRSAPIFQAQRAAVALPDQAAAPLVQENLASVSASLETLVQPEKLSVSALYKGGMDLENALAGGKSFAASSLVVSPDDTWTWLDSYTGQYETETSKIRKSYELALSNPKARAIKDNLPVNPVYKVQKGDSPFYARTEGDDLEMPGQAAAVILDEWMIKNLSPEFIAATLASMWVRHLYRETVPQSAEKTYMEGSVLIRVFMELTGSTARNWVGSLDHWFKENFQIYRHFYHWIKGFRYDNVRQGPYFKDKIMDAQGDPGIYTDDRGRKTLYQRYQDGEISGDAAAAAQDEFDQFVRMEQK